MKEQVLIDFLENKVTIEVLAADLRGSQMKTGHKRTTILIEEITEETEFVFTRQHLIILCAEVLKGNLELNDLNTIAFSLFTTEYMHREDNDDILDEVLFDLDNPEIGFPISYENVAKWKLLLETGENNFDYRELSRK